MPRISRRSFIAAGSAAALAYGAGRIYDKMPPSLSQARRYDSGEYGFATPPLKLQSSYRGKIKRSFVIGNERCKSEVGQFTQALADNFGDVVVFDNERQEPYNDIISEPSGFPALYMRDMFMVSADGSLLVSPVSLSVSRKMLKELKKIEGTLADKYGLEIKCAPFKFVGGQVLQTDGHTILPEIFNDQWTFIVDDTPFLRDGLDGFLGIYTRDYSADNTWLKDEMKKHFGKEIKEVPMPYDIYSDYGMRVEMAPRFFPLRGHLDMVITPVDRNKLLVGDNEKGLEILRSLDDAELRPYTEALTDHIRRYESKEIADTFNRSIQALRAGKTSLPSVLDGRLSNDFETISREAEEFCEKSPESVQRIPALLAPFSGISMAYNNAIVQNVPGEKIAIVPMFGVKALDQEAQRVFQKNGYRTVPVPFTEISYYGAGPHCMAIEIRERA